MDEKKKAELEELEKVNKLKKIARKKYQEETELIKKKSNTSFGKLILADEKNSPIFSFGGANRFSSNSNIARKQTPGPIYNITDKYKFSVRPNWSFGTGQRPNIYQSEKYEYFNHAYDDKNDLSKVNKRWNRQIGGAISIEPRIKYEFKEQAPGPGRYDPDVKGVKNKQPAYYFGEKNNSNSMNLLVGTNEIVGPGVYIPEKSKFDSRHNNPPTWTIPKDTRKGLNLKVFTKNETYYKYKYIFIDASSCATQIHSMKKSEPKISFGKSDRNKQSKLGIFPTTMSKQPTRVRIEHPKF